MDEAVQKVKMDMEIPEPENRVLTLQLQYLNVPEAAGFSDLPERKPKIAIVHIMKRVRPVALRQRMANVIKWEKDSASESAILTFDSFMIELVKHVKKMEEEHIAKSSEDKKTLF